MSPRVLHLPEELTIVSAAATKDLVVDALSDPTPLELDLSGVAELDTAGLQVLLLARREAHGRGVPLTLAGHGPEVHRALGLAGLADVLGADGAVR